MWLPVRLDGHRARAGLVPVQAQPRPDLALDSSTHRTGARELVGLLLAVALLAASDFHGIDSPLARSTATLLVIGVVAPAVLLWWRSSVGIAVFGVWAALNVCNLSSPLRSTRSFLFLLSGVLSVVLVVEVARLVGADRVRRYLTAYMTVLTFFVLIGLAVSGVARNSFSLSELRVETSALAIWKALVIISPCPSKWVPARLAFAGFKAVLVFLMIAIDRPKLGVLLALALSLGVGAIVVGLHRSARMHNLMLMCLTILPMLATVALALGIWLARVYARGADLSGRTVLWRTAIEEMERGRSVLGVGFRNSLTSPEAVDAIWLRFGRALGSWGNAVHNVYLQLVVELGIFGVAIMAGVLAVSVVGLLRINSVSMQASLAVDLLFVAGLCFVEPVLDPNRVVFVLLVLTIVRIREHADGARAT